MEALNVNCLLCGGEIDLTPLLSGDEVSFVCPDCDGAKVEAPGAAPVAAA